MQNNLANSDQHDLIKNMEHISQNKNNLNSPNQNIEVIEKLQIHNY